MLQNCKMQIARKELGRKINQWIEAVLAEMRWSAQTWAGKAGVSPSTLTRHIGSGESVPQQATLKKLNKVLAEIRPDLKLDMAAVRQSLSEGAAESETKPNRPPVSASIGGWIQGDGKVNNRPKRPEDMERMLRPVVLPGMFDDSGLTAFVVDDALLWPFKKGWILYFKESTLQDCIDEYSLVTLRDESRWFGTLRLNGNRFDLDHTIPTVSLRDVKIRSILRLEHASMSLPADRGQPS